MLKNIWQVSSFFLGAGAVRGVLVELSMQREQFHALQRCREGGEKEAKNLLREEIKEKNVSNEIKQSNKLHLGIVKGLDDENGYRSM
jgi:hypothetical protein